MIEIPPEKAAEIAVSQYSTLLGAAPSWAFKNTLKQKNGGEPPRLLRHVSVRFDEPVGGPIILGCKRYFGLGLMMALEDK